MSRETVPSLGQLLSEASESLRDLHSFNELKQYCYTHDPEHFIERVWRPNKNIVITRSCSEQKVEDFVEFPDDNKISVYFACHVRNNVKVDEPLFEVYSVTKTQIRK